MNNKTSKNKSELMNNTEGVTSDNMYANYDNKNTSG